MKKLALVLVSFLLLFSLVACSAQSSFEKAVAGNQYEKAIEIYNKKIKGNTEKETAASSYLLQYLTDAWNSYLDESISAEDFEIVLKNAEQINDGISVLDYDLFTFEAMFPEVRTSKASYSEGVAKMEEGDYLTAIEAFEQVSETDTKNYTTAQEQLTDATKLYIDSIVASATDKMNAGSYDEALTLIENAEEVIGAQTSFEQTKGSIYTAQFEAKMNSAAQAGDFASMCSIYTEALSNSYVTISSEMTLLKSEQEAAYVQSTIDRSIEAYKSGGYSMAIPVISEGLLLLPDNAKLLHYDELYKTCVPVTINDLTKIDGYYSFYSSDSDIYGNKYDNVIDISAGDKVQFSLNSMYTSLTAQCYPYINLVGDDVNDVELNIYADGVKVYSLRMDKYAQTSGISLDVTNVRILTIEVISYNDSMWNYCCKVRIANSVLTRTLTDADLYN